MTDFRNSRDEKEADVLVTVFEGAVEASQFLAVLLFVFGVEGIENRLVVFIRLLPKRRGRLKKYGFPSVTSL